MQNRAGFHRAFFPGSEPKAYRKLFDHFVGATMLDEMLDSENVICHSELVICHALPPAQALSPPLNNSLDPLHLCYSEIIYFFIYYVHSRYSYFSQRILS